jgi:hypothetical protein
MWLCVVCCVLCVVCQAGPDISLCLRIFVVQHPAPSTPSTQHLVGGPVHSWDIAVGLCLTIDEKHHRPLCFVLPRRLRGIFVLPRSAFETVSCVCCVLCVCVVCCVLFVCGCFQTKCCLCVCVCACKRNSESNLTHCIHHTSYMSAHGLSAGGVVAGSGVLVHSIVLILAGSYVVCCMLRVDGVVCLWLSIFVVQHLVGGPVHSWDIAVGLCLTIDETYHRPLYCFDD